MTSNTQLLLEAAGFRAEGAAGNRRSQNAAEIIYKNILNEGNAAPNEISECYLGLAKITGLRGDPKTGIEIAEKSLKEGVSYDLRTLVWLANQPHLDSERRKYYADIVLSAKPEELYNDDARNCHEWAKAKVCIGLAKAWIMQLNNFLNALEIGRAINDPYIIAECLIGLGKTMHQDRAEYLTEALDIGRRIGDLRVQSEALYRLGNTKRVPNEVQCYSEAIEIGRKLGDEIIQALCHIGLGNCRFDQERNYRTALDIGVRIHDESIQAQSLIGLGRVRVKEEVNCFQSALEIGRRIQDPKIMAESLIGLGQARVNDVANFKEALEIARRMPRENEKLQAEALIGLGNCLVNQKENYEAALYIGKNTDDLKIQAEALIGLGRARIDQQENYTLAIELSKRIKDDELQLKAHWGLVNARIDQEKNATAALEIATRIGDVEKQIHCIVRLAWCALEGENCDKARMLLYRGFEISKGEEKLNRVLNGPYIRLQNVHLENYRSGLLISQYTGNGEMQTLCYLGIYHVQRSFGNNNDLTRRNLDNARKLSYKNKRLRDLVETAAEEYEPDTMIAIAKRQCL